MPLGGRGGTRRMRHAQASTLRHRRRDLV